MLIVAKKVQDVYLKYKQDGVTTRSIYKTHIYPQFFISIATLYNYLAVNARKELRDYELNENDLNYLNVAEDQVNQEMLLAIREVIRLELASGNKDLLTKFGTIKQHHQNCIIKKQ